jgi:phage shock protein C
MVKETKNKNPQKKKSSTSIKKEADTSNEPHTRLYLSNEDKMIGGVCGGIGEHFDIDPLWVRLVMILLLFLDGIGFILYIILWILVPKNPNHKKTQKTYVEKKIHQIHTTTQEDVPQKKKGHIFVGGILIFLGILFLFDNFFSFLRSEIVWPVLLIGIGIILLVKHMK